MRAIVAGRAAAAKASAVPEGRRYTKAVAGMRVFGSRFAAALAGRSLRAGGWTERIRPESPSRSQTIVRSSMTSPLPSGRLEVPAASSTTAKARHATRIRQGRTPDEVFEHPPGAVEEDQVERKPHEGGVDARAGRQDQRLALRKPAAAEQPLPPRARVEGGDHAGGDRLAGANVPQPEPPLRLPHQRGETVGHGQRVTRIRVRKRTGRPSRVAGRNCHVLAAATSIRSW